MHLKKTLSLIAVAALLTSCTTTSKFNETGKYLTFQSPKLNIRVDYPESWKPTEDEKTNQLRIISPLPNTPADYNDGFTIRMDISPLAKSTELSALKQQVITSFQKQSKDFAITKESSTTINQLPAEQFSYTITLDSKKIFATKTIFLFNFDLYQVTYTSEEGNEDTLTQIYKTMLASLTFITPIDGASNYSSPADYTELADYANEGQKVALKYPKRWSINDGDGKTNKIQLFSRPDDKNDPMLESVTLNIGKILKDLTVKDAAEAFKKSSLKAYSDYAVTEEGPLTVNNLNAYFVIGTYTLNQKPMKDKQVVLFKDDRLFLFVATAEEPRFDGYMPVFDQIINSINPL
ncbi:MAG: DcrB-related protein [bacterium]